MNMQDIIPIAEKIKEAGGTLYLVGGAVRDAILKRENHDKDYAVEGLTKETFATLFPEAVLRGKDFAVWDIEGAEFALTRTERKKEQGHKGFEITTEKVSIEEDLKRRDLTINAIAQNVLTGEIVDPYGGREDIQKKVLRAVSDAFSEDPLRVYRTARFAAMLEWKVEDSTIEKMKMLKEELSTLPKERVFVEFRKALQTKKPSIFLETLRRAEVLGVHFKEIQDLIGSTQPEKYHPEGDSYQHTLLVVDKACELSEDILVRFGALVHDLGKGVTPKEMLPHHYGHDKKGVEVVSKFCNRIGTPNSWKKAGQTASRYHMLGGIFDKMSPPKKVDFIENVSKTILGLDGLQYIVIADKCSGQRICKEKEISFAKLGKEMLQTVNGKSCDEKEKELTGIAFKNRLREKRIKWIQNKVKKC